MRFVIREGSDPVATADSILLTALGLPGGGVVSVGRTFVLVRGGSVRETSAFHLGPVGRENAGVAIGADVDIVRAVLSPATRVVVEGDLPSNPRTLLHALQGRPAAPGDRIILGDHTVTVTAVEPHPGGLIGATTRFEGSRPAAEQPSPSGSPPLSAVATPPPDARRLPSSRDALLAGLDVELEILGGWISLLTSPADLPTAWGLPKVAGIVLEGPNGCGKSELVTAAAESAGATVSEIVVDLVYKPERLLDLLDKAVQPTAVPKVVFVDRLEALAGQEGLTPLRTQVAGILRWFLDTVAGRPGLACVLGVGSRSHLDPAIADSPLLPRTLTLPPPDLRRRALLFEAALARVPTDQVDYGTLATKSAGFSATDIGSAVVHAASRAAHRTGPVTEALLLEAVAETEPSLGSVSLGEMPSYGFDAVADLAETKRRLIEAVVWPVRDPARFSAMGIDPPRGVLLFGPPGTGKTFVVRALAHEAGAAFFPVKGAELLDKFVGESERAVRELFARARAAAPAIIFFDELDALAPVRGRSLTAVTDSVVAALLTEMDGIVARGDLAVIGATNRPDLIDPALLRAGRFEIQIELGLPDAAARAELLAGSDVPFGPDVDLDRLASAADGASFADLTGILREAALGSLRRDDSARTVAWADIEASLARWSATRR